MKLACFVLIVAIWLPPPVASQSDPGVMPLEAGSVVDRSISSLETHRYRLALTSGQYLRIVVDHKGTGLRASFLGPDEAKLAAVESSADDSDSLTIALLAPASGAFLLQISLRESSAAGSYQVRVVDWRAALPEDDKRVAAFQADNEGDRLRAVGKAESRRQAVERYEAALKLWQAAHDPRGEALTDAKLGSVFFALGNFGKALEQYLQGLALTRILDDRALEAQALNSAGGAYTRVGQPDKALAMLEPALEIQKDLGDQRAQANTLNSLAFTYDSTGQPQKALERLEALNDDHCRRLAAKAKGLGRKLLAELASIVTPEILLAWHRN